MDASLFPKIPRKNTIALTYAVGEIAASKILGYELEDLFDASLFGMSSAHVYAGWRGMTILSLASLVVMALVGY